MFAGIVLASLLCLTAASIAYPQTNEYQDSGSGVSLSLPPGWRWIGPDRWGEQQSTLLLREPETHQEVRLYVQILSPPDLISAEAMDKKLSRRVQHKIRQRTREGYKDYHLRENSCELHSLGGRSALSWISEFTENGRNMVEYVTRVRSENTNARFFAKLPAERFDDFKRRIDPVIDTVDPLGTPLPRLHLQHRAALKSQSWKWILLSIWYRNLLCAPKDDHWQESYYYSR
ncbi:MAG: hypothetical protein WB762_02295 [Candidatus Sulfotelmatobacter sp.]